MNITYKTSVMEFIKYTYSSIAAKLSVYADTRQNVRLITSFASNDPNRDRANLSFLKQFGIVPQDHVSEFGGINSDELSNLDACNGLTIIVESIGAINIEPDGVDIASAPAEKTMASNVSQFYSAGSTGRRTEDPVNIINRQNKMLSCLLEAKRDDFIGGYIYISGFSCITSSGNNNKTSSSCFSPWYFEFCNAEGKQKVITQPELKSYLDSLEEQPPLIANLEHLLDGMGNCKIYD